MIRVKICGITNVRDARLAARLGADALGFIFVRESVRYIKPARAGAIIAALPPFICKGGVFVNEDPERVNEISAQCGLDAVQLHGDETPRDVERVRHVQRIKAVRVRTRRDIARCRRYQADAFLLDAYVRGRHGGTGETFDWELAREAEEFGPVILAGGLTADNVEEAIRTAHPYAVDTASGVEVKPGIKDKRLMDAFIRIAKTTEI